MESWSIRGSLKASQAVRIPSEGCVRVCVYVARACACMHTHMFAGMCRGQRLISHCLPQSFLCLFSRQGLSLTLEFVVSDRLNGQWPITLFIPLSLRPSTGLTGYGHHI